MKTKKKPELLAPVSDWATLNTAIDAGCDAVYLGVDSLNMRAKAKNFTLNELIEVTGFCHSRNVDLHLTVNSIVYENELSLLEEIIINLLKLIWSFAGICP